MATPRRNLRKPATLVALVLALGVLAGCGGDDDEPAATGDVSEPTSTTAEGDGVDDDSDVEEERLLVFDADLQALNGEDAFGAATFQLDGDQLTVTINSSRLSPGLSHAQHLHIGGRNECPDDRVDRGDDDVLSTIEGAPAYGEVRIALTVEGEVTAESALAVDRFPTAGADGALSYERTFTLPETVTADELADGVVVQHGVSELDGDPAAYDGSAESSLDPSLPLEATAPATCGALEPTGTG